MAAVNKVILLGNLGSDINVRHLPDGRPVGNVNIATTEQWRDREGNKSKHTEWHRLVFFGRQAEIANDYLRKGSPLYVEGQLRTRKWEDKNGVSRETTEIRVLQFQMLGSRGSRDDDQQGRDAGRYDKDSDAAVAAAPAPDRTTGAADKGGGDSFQDMEENLPW